jgi:hypothetical protein
MSVALHAPSSPTAVNSPGESAVPPESALAVADRHNRPTMASISRWKVLMRRADLLSFITKIDAPPTEREKIIAITLWAVAAMFTLLA